MSAMAEPGTAQHAPRQHVVVVGADTTTVRLAEELVTELTVSASSAAPGRSLRQLEEPGASRILAWSRSPGDELAMGTS